MDKKKNRILKKWWMSLPRWDYKKTDLYTSSPTPSPMDRPTISEDLRLTAHIGELGNRPSPYRPWDDGSPSLSLDYSLMRDLRSEVPRVQRSGHAHIPDLQKLWNINIYCFKPLCFDWLGETELKLQIFYSLSIVERCKRLRIEQNFPCM